MEENIVPGRNVAWEERGCGATTLVFVHGAGCTKETWRSQVQQLSKDFRVVALDLPGHGESDVTPLAEISVLADAVVALSASGNPASVVIIGHSMGCRVALEAYTKMPSLVKALVFVDGSLFAESQEEATAMEKIFRENPMRELLVATFEAMFLASSSPALRQEILTQAMLWNHEFGRALLIDMVHWDVERAASALSRVAVPVLIIQSTYMDKALGRRSLATGMTTPWMDLVTATVPVVVTRIVPNVGHFPQLEEPEIVNAAIERFVGSL